METVTKYCKLKIGDRHEKLTILKYIGNFKPSKNHGSVPLLLCQCDCGNTCQVFSNKFHRNKSCGCMGEEARKRGRAKIKEYNDFRERTCDTGPNYVLNYYKTNAKKRGIEFLLSEKEFKSLIDKNCFYCGCEPYQVFKKHDKIRYIYNGVDRLDGNKPYILNNCVPCCGKCNVMKMTMDKLEFYSKVRNVSKKIARKVEINDLLSLLKVYREKKLKITVVSGVFDLYHSGHSNYIKFASQFGDVLIVGINDDKSVTALKGPTRPINNEQSRLEVISSLSCVDHCCIYSDTAEFLSLIKPDFWIKGCEYSLETLNQTERKIVEEGGGKIVFAPREYEISTTKILEKLK